ncbi:MAG: hypothetical protein KF730_13010 [Sphingomonas sp.]|uniref:hypothetical protein n=1 Tax=Sphingomonas sp. TaxID=28214 RepID=UPI0025CBADAC|nr:hypothetical protein [Sphingomonas sp.]MBX3565483.1 hypothetical protein [Sphingomonas sp.]
MTDQEERRAQFTRRFNRNMMLLPGALASAMLVCGFTAYQGWSTGRISFFGGITEASANAFAFHYRLFMHSAIALASAMTLGFLAWRVTLRLRAGGKLIPPDAANRAFDYIEKHGINRKPQGPPPAP